MTSQSPIRTAPGALPLIGHGIPLVRDPLGVPRGPAFGWFPGRRARPRDRITAMGALELARNGGAGLICSFPAPAALWHHL
jgi:hypothetical protein